MNKSILINTKNPYYGIYLEYYQRGEEEMIIELNQDVSSVTLDISQMRQMRDWLTEVLETMEKS